MAPYKNYSIDECAKTIKEKFDSGKWPADTKFYQKWTCEKCGERVTGENPNRLFTEGHHSEKDDGTICGHTTDLRIHGCNYMVHFRLTSKSNITDLL